MVDFDVCLFLLYVFFVLLMKSFCFCTKNIDWRLPCMKLIVSIILYWILSYSSLYIAPFCWSLWSWFIYTYTLIYMCIIYILYILHIYIYITYLSVYLSIYLSIYLSRYIYIYIYIYILQEKRINQFIATLSFTFLRSSDNNNLFLFLHELIYCNIDNWFFYLN